MLLFAISLEHILSLKVISNITKHYYVIIEELADLAIKIVNINYILLSILKGLKDLIVECLYYINFSNI
jgi:hypothetical protein